MSQLSAPIFAFGEAPALGTEDSYTRPMDHSDKVIRDEAIRLDGMLAMTGPSVKVDPGCLPVRGDLAHIKLAGRYFVPHYAVPMPHAAKAGTVLRNAPRADGESIAELTAGSVFNVLDIAGAWAWGQVGEEGRVGYVALDGIEALPGSEQGLAS